MSAEAEEDRECAQDVTVTTELRYAGSCRHPKGMVLRGASWRPTSFPALFAVLRHPRYGITLFDTGYTPRFLKETLSFPALLHRWLTPMILRDDDTAARQLEQVGLDPATVQRIVLSHFHADHIGGARDFPNARFIASEEAYQTVVRCGAFGRLRRGFLPALLPDDFAHRVDLLRPDDFSAGGIAAFGPSHDLFGDGSVEIIPLPGHAAGQIGALVRAPGGRRLLLIADAAWTTASIRENRPPHPLTNLIMENGKAATRTLKALHALAESDPSLDIVPSHCPERAAAEASQPGSRR